MRRNTVLHAYNRATYLIKHRQLCSKNLQSSFICACSLSQSKHFCMCAGACTCDCTPLLKRPVSCDFVMTKVPKSAYYKSVSSSIVKRNRKIQFCLSLSNNYSLGNLKKIFCFHNSTILINIVKVTMSVVMGILNLSSIDITQQVFSVCFVKSFNCFCRFDITRYFLVPQIISYISQ